MRQGNGADLLGVNDPRSASIGIIYVTPTDDRKSVLAAILTQEKLGRKQVAVALPIQNKAFQRPADFDDLRSLRRKLQSQLVFIVPGGSGPAELARQRRFVVYSSLENYASALRDQDLPPAEPQKKKRGLFGSSRFKNTPPLPLSAAAEQSASREEEPVRNRRNGVLSAPSPRGRYATPASAEDEYDDRDDGMASALVGGAAAGAAMAGAEALYNAQARSTPHLDAPNHDEEDVDNVDAMNIGEPPRMSRFNTDSGEEKSGDNDEDDDDAVSLPAPVPVPVTDTARDSAASPPSSQPASPEAIDLQPVRPRGRSTLKLPPRDDAAVAAGSASAAAASRPSQRPRSSGKLGGAAAGSAVAASAAQAASGQPPRGNLNRGGGGGAPRGNRPNRPWWIVALLILGVLIVLFAIVFSLAYAYPRAFNFPLPSVPGIKTSAPATVTITPDSKEVGNSYVIIAIPNGTPNADQHQISARTLSSQQARTGTVTGTGHNQIPATTAKGSLTFLNGSFSSSFTVGTNTPIPAGNTSVYLDVPAVIPAATTAGFGTVTVSAHAATSGAAGNIPALTISGTCCVAGGSIQVHNNSAFTGGQDAKNYNFVQQGDVDAFASTAKAQLTQQANKALTSQLKSGEQLAQATNCPANVQSSNPVGDHGTNIPSTSVTVTVTCKAEAYDQNGMNSLVTSLLQQKAKTGVGANYSEQGNPIIHSQVQQINDDQSVSLIVTARGLWVYQFSNQQKQQLARLIAGKTVNDAKTLLTAQMGVQDATISTNGSTLPTDPSQISIVIQAVPNLQDTGAPTYPTPGNAVPGSTPGPQPARGDSASLIDFAYLDGRI
jgi:VCBS repeat-containing protein